MRLHAGAGTPRAGARCGLDRGGDREPLGGEHEQCDVRRPGDGRLRVVHAEGEVHPPGGDGRGGVVHVDLDRPQADPGALLPDPNQRLRQQRRRGGAEDADEHPGLRAPGQARQRLPGLAGQRQQPHRVVREQVPGVGELHAPPDLGDQLGPDRPFQGGHLLGHGAGRVAQGHRGRRHAARVPDGDQGPQLHQVQVDVHAAKLNGAAP